MQARPLLDARARGEPRATTSVDLGFTAVGVRLAPEGVCPDGPHPCLPWEAIERVAGDDSGCWELRAGGPERIRQMSAATGRLASLYPTHGPPALLLSGTLMHRIKGIDPAEDTRRKLASLGRLRGLRLLDTATGLGYTAIAAARQGARVVTVEWDPAVVAVACRNPWSAALFTDPAIGRREADVARAICGFEDGAFDRILHDPPAFELAGDVYGGAFYRQLRRALAPRGRLFHYIGNLDSPSGARVARGAERRLQEAGFSRVQRHPDAFGLSARA